MPTLSKDEQKSIHPTTTVLALSIDEKKRNELMFCITIP
jgi:hypothetical protein